MSMFGALMADVEDDPFFGSHMRHMRQMNNMMNSMFSDPFGMFGGGVPLSIMAPGRSNAMMPFMPQMPSMDRMFAGSYMDGGSMGGGMGGGMGGTSFSSSTVVMSSGPNGKPQVYSSSSSTKIGPNGIKETRKTLQDSRTGTKKIAIGHHIGERAHVVAREQNYYTGDAEEHQEFINLEEEEADDFNREFQMKAGSVGAGRARAAITAGAHAPHAPHVPAGGPHGARAPPRDHSRLALPAPPSPEYGTAQLSAQHRRPPAARRPLRPAAAVLATPASVRDVYGGSHPQRHRHKHHKTHRHSPADN